MDIELGVPGQIMPPADKAVDFAQRMESAGFDAVWWPDHLMGWHPDSIWTEDMTPLAAYQPSSHVYFDPLVMMGTVGSQLDTMRVGSCVTDLLRKHPAATAASLLTLDHVTRGKAILGVGTGEQLNVTPYGMNFDKPVGKLSEGIDVMRLLMAADGPVDYDGKHFRLKDAVLGLSPYGEELPQIWTAAHGPRMLGLTGQKADGWLPTKMTPAAYRDSLDAIRTSARDNSRDADAITPGMLGYVLVGPDEDTVQRLTEHPLVRMLCVLLPNRVFEALGVDPPLAGAGSGFHDFIPTRVPRAEAERIIAAIPPKVVRHYAFCGTVEQITEEVADFHDAGLRHLIMWNITAFGDPSLAKFSFQAMGQLKDALRAR